jgi:hypothetical protein
MMQREAALNVALSVIRKRLSDAHKIGESINVDKLIADIMNQYEIDEEVSKNVNTRYKLAMIVLVSLEEKKNYAQLAEYLIHTLVEMEANGMFDKYNYRIKIELLTFICRYSIKSKNYDLCEKYLAIVKKEHSLYPEHTFLNIQSVMIEYVFLVSSGRLQEAGKIIYDVQKNPIYRIIEEDDYYFVKLHANLISFNYFSGNLSEAKKHMRDMLLSEKRQKNHDGLNAVVCSHLIDCMINIEVKDYDYALFKIKAMQKRFVTFLAQPNNVRYAVFLRLLKHISQNPKYVSTSAFKDEATEFLAIKDIEVGSVEFVPFNPYVISKLNKRTYYDVFCELVRNN